MVFVTTSPEKTEGSHDVEEKVFKKENSFGEPWSLNWLGIEMMIKNVVKERGREKEQNNMLWKLAKRGVTVFCLYADYIRVLLFALCTCI